MPARRMEQRRPRQSGHAHGAGRAIVLLLSAFRFPGHLSFPTDRERIAAASATTIPVRLRTTDFYFCTRDLRQTTKLPGILRIVRGSRYLPVRGLTIDPAIASGSTAGDLKVEEVGHERQRGLRRERAEALASSRDGSVQIEDIARVVIQTTLRVNV